MRGGCGSQEKSFIYPKETSDSNDGRADFLDGWGPFPEGDQDDEGADEKGNLGEFDTDVEGDERKGELICGQIANFLLQDTRESQAVQQAEPKNEVEAGGFEFFDQEVFNSDPRDAGGDQDFDQQFGKSDDIEDSQGEGDGMCQGEKQ